MVYRIGNLELNSRIFLSPLHDVNDIAFRILCRRAGAALTFTGLTNPKNPNIECLEDNPALQLFGTSTEGISDFIRAHDSRVSLWDFNLGCPSKLSGKLSHGAYMHHELEVLREIFLTMRASTNKPCTVKLRKSEYAIQIAQMAEECGFDAVGIHPRTKKQGYDVSPDYDFALQLKQSVGIPVIYSGNVDVNNYKQVLEDFDFCYVGRSAMGNPNIFLEMGCMGDRVSFLDYLLLAEEYELYFRQIKAHAMMFTHGLSAAKQMRRDLIRTKSVAGIRNVYLSNGICA